MLQNILNETGPFAQRGWRIGVGENYAAVRAVKRARVDAEIVLERHALKRHAQQITPDRIKRISNIRE